MEFLQTIDNEILVFIKNNLQNELFDKIMPYITSLGNKGLLFIIITFFLIFNKKTRKVGITLFTALILCVLVGNILLKPAIARQRPFDVFFDIELLINKPKDFSFPSGHTMAAFACAQVIYQNNKKMGIIMFFVAFIIAYSRLYLFVHYPSDVLAGIILGMAIGFFAQNIKIKKAEIKW